MLEAGEDPRFPARRMVIFAAEDVGNADPFAAVLANAAWDAVERVGMPECRINLGQAVCYLATCPKSNASYLGIEAALKDVREGRTLPVPRHLRDASHKGAAKAFGHAGYKYAHDHKGGWVDQEYVPTDAVYYEPTDRGHEAKIKARLDELRAKRKAKRGEPGASAPGGEEPR
jgi:putative ATPase